MRLRHMEVLHAVYVTGSVSGGARALNVSQPTVSKVLKHAEDQLGFALFHRAQGRLSPTKKGELLFAEVTPIFEKIGTLRSFTAKLARDRVIGCRTHSKWFSFYSLSPHTRVVLPREVIHPRRNLIQAESNALSLMKKK